MVREGPHPPGTADRGRQASEIMLPQAGVPYLAADRLVNDGPTPQSKSVRICRHNSGNMTAQAQLDDAM
jgi:hypothetical protein